MSNIYPRAIAVLLVIWLVPLGTASGQVQMVEGRRPFMREYLLPASPLHIVAETPQRVWFTLPAANAIGSLAVGATAIYTEYALPTPASEPYNLAIRDGVVWFSQRTGNRIGRLDIATGAIEEFTIPTPASEPTGIAIAPDGRVWFVGRSGNQIGRLDPATGVVEEYFYTTPGAHFEGLALANSEVAWATAPNLNQVVYLDLSWGEPRFRPAFTIPHPQPRGIVLDLDNIAWLAPAASDFIIRYAPGTLSLWRPYPLATTNSELAAITFHDGGSTWELWFTERSAGRAGQLIVEPSGAPISLREADLPTPGARPWGIAVDANSHVWIADSQHNLIVAWFPPYFGETPLTPTATPPRVGSPPPPAIPEPVTVVLFGAGLAALGSAVAASRRRKR
jgi:streptogramin lyase